MDEEHKKILKYLRLWGLLSQWEELLAEAQRGRFSHERMLQHVLQAEFRTRSESARLLRRKRANIPEFLEIETFPFHRQPKLNRQRIMSLYDRFDYLTKQQNIVWLGPTGCGKTGLATGFLLQAIDRGYRGYFITFPERHTHAGGCRVFLSLDSRQDLSPQVAGGGQAGMSVSSYCRTIARRRRSSGLIK